MLTKAHVALALGAVILAGCGGVQPAAPGTATSSPPTTTADATTTAATTTAATTTEPAPTPTLTGFGEAGTNAMLTITAAIPQDPAAQVVAAERTLKPTPEDMLFTPGVPYLVLSVRVRSVSEDDILYAKWLAAMVGSRYQSQVGDDAADSVGGALMTLETVGNGPLDWHGVLKSPDLELPPKASQQDTPKPVDRSLADSVTQALAGIAGSPQVLSLDSATVAGAPVVVLHVKLADAAAYGASVSSGWLGDARPQVAGFFVWLQDAKGSPAGTAAVVSTIGRSMGTIRSDLVPLVDPNLPLS